jgi:ribose-phosphate pyrophosphokinase
VSSIESSATGRTLNDEMVVETQTAGTVMRRDYDKRLMLVAGRANPVLAARIADKLGVELSSANLKTFANGEVYCRYDESVRGADVFIVQPTCGNAATGMTANDSVMELLELVDAAVGGSAHRVIAVSPWYGYSRQDKKSAPREPISARLVARMLESAGIDRILTMDLHSGQIQGFFQKPCDHMTALFMLTQYFADLGLEDLVVVSPDVGRVKLNKNFAAKIGADLAILNKERPAQQVAEISYVIGDVRDKTALLVDDMIGTAGTLAAAAQAVRDAGARRIYAAATHGNFSGNAWENLARAGLEQVVVTDTIPLPPGAPDNVRVLSCADLLTNSIRQIFTDGSVSDVFGGENQLFELARITTTMTAAPTAVRSVSAATRCVSRNAIRAPNDWRMRNQLLLIFSRLMSERGQTMAEYGILIAVIALVVVIAAVTLGSSITGLFHSASTKM